MTQEVFTIKELRKIGYGRNMLQRLARDPDAFREVGFRDGRQIYFWKTKLEKYLERRTKWQS